MRELHEVDKRLSMHEAVCAERYGALLARMSRMEKIVISVAGSLILTMGGAIWQLLAVAAALK